MKKPRAIETHWHGYRFRSRLEARWAVFFDCLEIEFSYEPEGFHTDVGGYLPDFFFPQVRCYGEVKPCALTPSELAKATWLCEAKQCHLILLIAPPNFQAYPTIYWDCGYPTITDCLLDIDFHQRVHYEAGRFFSCTAGEFRGEETFTPRYREAVYASRSARFENEDPLDCVPPRLRKAIERAEGRAWERRFLAPNLEDIGEEESELEDER